ncbi:peptide chain release factor 1 [bacterium]|nr:peptide chain release factor 1 [candidate division CSSED10-310 bacterium]
MLDKLASYVIKHEELTEKLADPAVISDRERYLTLSREYSEIQEYCDIYFKLKKAIDNLKGAREIIDTEEDDELIRMAQSEVEELEKKISGLEEQAEELLNPPDPFDGKNVILEIRAGTGGEEAGLFAADLFRMYARYAEKQKWKLEILSQSLSELDGFKEVIAMISGHRVYGMLKYESGVHRVQRVPVTETSGRIHTSAVTVAVLPEAENVEVEIDPSEIRIDVFRSSGPGGQSVNTTDSAVRITHIPTGLVVSCQDEKSQLKNKSKGLKILYSRLLDLKRREQDEKIAAERREMVSTGDRSAKIRTYNFPQNRITDHRVNFTTHQLESVLQGDLDDIFQAIHDYFRVQSLQQIG